MSKVSQKVDSRLCDEQIILDLLDDIIFLIDQEGHIYYANEAALSTLGLNLEQLQEKTLSEIFTSTGEVSSESKNMYQSLNMLAADGEEVPVSYCRKPYSNGELIIVKPLAVQPVYQELCEVREQALQNSKMAVLGEMAGGVAHEINNPIAIISGRAEILEELLEEGLMNDEMLRKSVKGILEQSLRVSKIVNSLKNFSRNSEQDPFEWVELEYLLNDVRELCVEPLKKSEVELTLDPVPDILVSCRLSELEQVFLNLVHNSFDAIKSLDPRWIRINVKQRDSFVDIRVIDCGPGIPEEIRGKILDAFYTTKPVGVGTGLGLSISKKIIEHHKGKLSIDSESPNTCFVVTLPCKNA